MTITLEAPVRIDFCGGYTDLADISQVTGTAIANLAIDLYRDAARTQKVAFSVTIGPASPSASPHSDANQALLAAVDRYAAVLGIEEPVSQYLTIDVDVPVSMGLGVSSALCVMLTSSVRLHQGWTLPTIRQQAFHDAQVLEKEILQVKGGYQDFIPAIYGGYNMITAKADATEVDHLIKQSENLSIQTQIVPPALAAYFNHCVVIVYALRPTSSSSTIIDDIITRSQQELSLVEVSRQIHHYNTVFHGQICQVCQTIAPTPVLSLPIHPDQVDTLSQTITQAWALRQQFSALATNPLLDQVSHTVGPETYCAHGVGAGGSVLVLYGKPDCMGTLRAKLATLTQQLGITVFYPAVNQTGLGPLAAGDPQ